MNTLKSTKTFSCGQENCNLLYMVHGHYQLDGPPIPLLRPRLSKRRLWDSQKENKLVTGITLKQQHTHTELFHGPLILIVKFFFGFPKKMPQAQRRKLLHKPYEKIPDLSNLIKYIEDAATTVLYHDDCIITKIRATKQYEAKPRTVFIIGQENGTNTSGASTLGTNTENY